MRNRPPTLARRKSISARAGRQTQNHAHFRKNSNDNQTIKRDRCARRRLLHHPLIRWLSVDSRHAVQQRRHRKLDELPALRMAEQVGMRLRRPAEDVQRHARLFAHCAHAMVRLVGWQQVGDAARRVVVLPGLLERAGFARARRLGTLRPHVLRLLIDAGQHADHAPGAVVVHATARALRKDDGDDEERAILDA